MTPPSEWISTRLDRVATVNARIGWKALTAGEYQDDGFAFLSTPNIKGREIDFANVNYISQYRYDESPELRLAVGDVLLAKDGNTLGVCNVVRSLPRPATVNGSIAVIRPFAADSRFMHYWLSASPSQGLIDSLKDGMGVPHLFQSDIKRMPISLPDREVQRRIGDFLDAEVARIDNLAEITRRQLGLLDEWLTEMLRIETAGGGSADTAGDEIPLPPDVGRDWELRKVGRAFITGSGTTPRSSDPTYFGGPHSWVNTGDLRDGVVAKPRKTVTDKALRDYPVLRVYPAGSLVVAMYGATIGRIGILSSPACVNQACCVLLPLGSVRVDYAFYWFLARRMEIVRLASGGGQPNISQDLVRSLRISVPVNDRDQAKIVAECAAARLAADHRKVRLYRRLELLAERRQAVITAAVTGQIDVSTASGVAV